MIGASPVGAFPVGARAFLYALTEDVPAPPDPAEGGPATVSRSADTAGTTKLVFEWESDADGEVELTTGFPVDGRLLAVQWTPDGEAPPTSGYDSWLFDADRHDVLLGQGANRSASTTERVGKASLGAVANSTLTLAIRNAGAAARGTITVTVG